MSFSKRPWWQQATALVTVSAGGVITGLNFVPGSATTATSPASVPLHLLALEQGAQPSAPGGGASAQKAAADKQLRSAIVRMAEYYLRLAQSRTPNQMESLIWDNVSTDGADHGPTCAAFASLTLELAAQAVGQESWVSGGKTYPWPLPHWADPRVDTNPDSPDITSMVADAQSHDRYHPLGDGYVPQSGDWVLFNEHVEVVTAYSDGVMHSIGASSLPNLTVNAHAFGPSMSDAGVEGYIDNGQLTVSETTTATQPATQPTASKPARTTQPTKSVPKASPPAATQQPASPQGSATKAKSAGRAAVPGVLSPGTSAGPGTAAIPGTSTVAVRATSTKGSSTKPTSTKPSSPRSGTGAAKADVPGAVPAQAGLAPATTPATKPAATKPTASKPAKTPSAAPTASTAPTPGPTSSATASSSGRQYATPGTPVQQAFIDAVAPGAIAAQQRYGVPAAVTIAQAIDESGWGGSSLAANYHNLFGIKGSGPAGSVTLPTSEFYNGQWVTINAQFRAYHNDAESISDHAQLLATSGYYTRAMADRSVPDAFASDLTGIYATDPNYGSSLIALMKLYNLYRFSPAGQTATPAASPTQTAAPTHTAAPAHTATPAPPATLAPTATPIGSSTPAPTPSATPTSTPANAGTPPATSTVSPPARPAATPASRPSGQAQVPGATAPVLTPAGTGFTAVSRTSGQVTMPGMVSPRALAPTTAAPRSARTASFTHPSSNIRVAGQRTARGPAVRYDAELPHAVTTALFVSAKAPLSRSEHLYRDVAAQAGVQWQLLAAADWMQCKADPRRSPVHGEKLGSLNPDGSSYTTKSRALAQCASELTQLAHAVYGIDVASRRPLSVRELADTFAAFRWGALLRRNGVSAMEFPYSVAGLTAAHQKMHWPGIDAPDAPDRPGARFREPFGAVPVVLSLNYQATV